MNTERIALRVELLKIAAEKDRTPDGILALAKKFEGYVLEGEERKSKKEKSDNVKSQQAPD